MADLQAIKDIMSLYEQALGQMINREKTTIFFSKAVNEDTKALISYFLQVPEVKEYENYLGLSVVKGVHESGWVKLNPWVGHFFFYYYYY